MTPHYFRPKTTRRELGYKLKTLALLHKTEREANAKSRIQSECMDHTAGCDAGGSVRNDTKASDVAREYCRGADYVCDDVRGSLLDLQA